MIGLRYSASRRGVDKPPRTAIVVDDDDELYTGFNEVSPALDTRSLREDQAFQQTIRTAGMGRQNTSRVGTGVSDALHLNIYKNFFFFNLLNVLYNLVYARDAYLISYFMTIYVIFPVDVN